MTRLETPLEIRERRRPGRSQASHHPAHPHLQQLNLPPPRTRCLPLATRPMRTRMFTEIACWPLRRPSCLQASIPYPGLSHQLAMALLHRPTSAARRTSSLSSYRQPRRKGRVWVLCHPRDQCRMRVKGSVIPMRRLGCRGASVLDDRAV
jgi:hypothetical protein